MNVLASGSVTIHPLTAALCVGGALVVANVDVMFSGNL